MNLTSLLDLFPAQSHAANPDKVLSSDTVRGACPYDAMKAAGALTRDVVDAVEGISSRPALGSGLPRRPIRL